MAVNTPVSSVTKEGGDWIVKTTDGTISSKRIIFTTALPIISEMIKSWAPSEYLDSLNRIQYIGNVCLVLELDRPLSETYWLNVNDPSFPFVGVHAHTTFERPETYGGRHIVYLSKYLPHTDRLYSMTADEFLDYAIPFIQKMFPRFDRTWIQKHHLWRARWSQPVVEKYYSTLIPDEDGPAEGLHICTMAQIYPEDRGTNYAIREGRRIGRKISRSPSVVN